MNKIAILFLLVLLSCGRKETTNDAVQAKSESVVKLTEKQRELMEIETVELAEKALSETIYVNGKIDIAPNQSVSINNAFGGSIEAIDVLPGESFKKGQILVKIVNNQFIEIQEAYLATKEKLAVAQLDFNRQQTLNQQKVSSDKTFQQAKMEMQTLRINEKSLEEKLRLIGISPESLSTNSLSRTVVIRAPFEGTVNNVLVNKGKFVSPNDVILEIMDNAHKLVQFSVFEKDVIGIQTGMKVSIFSANDRTAKASATIIAVGSQVLSDGTVQVHAKLEPTTEPLLVGMFVKGAIYRENQPKMVVPALAVVEFEGRKFVFVEETLGTYSFHEVKVGIEQNNWIEIQNSSTFNKQKIVTKGAYALLMALKNEVEE